MKKPKEGPEEELYEATSPESFIPLAAQRASFAEARRAYALELCMTIDGLHPDWKSMAGDIAAYLKSGKLHEAQITALKGKDDAESR